MKKFLIDKKVFEQAVDLLACRIEYQVVGMIARRSIEERMRHAMDLRHGATPYFRKMARKILSDCLKSPRKTMQAKIVIG